MYGAPDNMATTMGNGQHGDDNAQRDDNAVTQMASATVSR